MTTKRLEKLKQAVLDCYQEMYANATPKADFKKLMETCPKNERGQIDIPFMNYGIEEKKYDQILNKFLTDKKLKMTKREQDDFKVTINLGCSPKIIFPKTLEE